jgi:peptidoglycan hydrolase-like protein with peptidoglycan-binding domain
VLYYVIENTPGYAPEMDPYCFFTEDSAIDCAVSLKHQLENAGYDVYGDPIDGFYGTREDGDRGRFIQIICQEVFAAA